MAANLQLLKRRIKTASNIAQIAKAMEMMAASKIKKAQTAVENNKPYSDRVIKIATRLIQNINTQNQKFEHPFINNKSQSESALIIAISPDKGLCGSLNTNFFRKIFEVNNTQNYLITVGTKISRFASRLDMNLIATYEIGNTLPTFAKVYDLTGFIKEYYNPGKVSKVQLAYTEFNSFFSQTPTINTILPITFSQKDIETPESLPYLFEPSVEEILSSLLPHYLEIRLYSALIEAYTSEQAARMMAMQNAKNNATDIASALTLAYNKSRQEKITNEILDITNNAQI